MTKKVLVLGAGITGLAAAIRLKKAGFDVVLLDKNERTGGKLHFVQLGEYYFDVGPSILTGIDTIEDVLRCGNAENEIKFKKIEPSVQYFDQGQRIRSFTDEKLFLNQLSDENDRNSLLKYLKKVAVIYQTTASVFVERALHKLSKHFNWDTLLKFLNFGKIQAFQSMNHANKNVFKNGTLVKMANFFASFNGSNPYRTPATYNLIAYYTWVKGVFLPEKGMHQIVDVFTDEAKGLNVDFRLNTNIRKLVINENNFILESDCYNSIQADYLLNTMDVDSFYKQFIPRTYYLKKYLNQEKAGTAVVFLFAVNRKFEHLQLHNVFFAANQQEEYDYLEIGDKPYFDPSIYLNITSKEIPSHAPLNGENWFVYVPVGKVPKEKWDNFSQELEQYVLDKLSNQLNIDLRTYIHASRILHQQFHENLTAAFNGGIYGNSSNGFFSAFLRHPNQHPKLKRLFFAGGTVHPGPGVPLCLWSAKIASDLIIAEAKN